MCAMKKIRIGADHALTNYEKRAIERSSGDLLLPVTIVEQAEEMQLLYLTDGHTALSEYLPRDLTDVFLAARCFVSSLAAGRDRLLEVRRFFLSPDCVYIHNRTRAIRLLFGDVKTEERHTCAEVVAPVLRTLAGFRHIVGAKSAFERIMEQIRMSNPGFADIRKLITAVEREWSRIQPRESSNRY
jgi:hypothetical protein